MEFFELIKKRYSVRAYQSKPIEDEKLQKVLEAARIAPTAANRQPFRFIVIHTQGRESELRLIYKREWFILFVLRSYVKKNILVLNFLIYPLE